MEGIRGGFSESLTDSKKKKREKEKTIQLSIGQTDEFVCSRISLFVSQNRAEPGGE